MMMMGGKEDGRRYTRGLRFLAFAPRDTPTTLQEKASTFSHCFGEERARVVREKRCTKPSGAQNPLALGMLRRQRTWLHCVCSLCCVVHSIRRDATAPALPSPVFLLSLSHSLFFQ